LHVFSGSEMGFREDCGGSRGVGRKGWRRVVGVEEVVGVNYVGNGKT
jgi:hypothetical protein